MTRIEQRITKAIEWATIVVFVLLVGGPMVAAPFGIGVGSDTGEKRNPAAFPSLKGGLEMVRFFPVGFEMFYKDRFGFRGHLITWHSLLYTRWLHTSPSPLVIMGKRGWLFYNGVSTGDGDALSDYRRVRPLSHAWLERWRWTFQDLQEWHAKHGIPFLLAIVPSKGLVYPEFLPHYLAPIGDQTPLDQIAEYLAEKTDVHFLDVTPALVAARQEEPTFYRLDSHWTPYGAYAGYAAIMRELEPALHQAPTPLSAFERPEEQHRGDLAQLLALHERGSEGFKNLIRREAARATHEEIPRANRPDEVTEISDDSLPRLVMYRDSYSEEMIGLLGEHFRRAFFRWNAYGFDGRVVRHEKPDAVVVEMGDRRLRVGYRISSDIILEMAADRYAAADRVLARYAPGSFESLKPERNVVLSPTDDGLMLHAQNTDPHIWLPAIPECVDYQPIIELDVTFPVATEARVTWHREEEGPVLGRPIPTRVSAPGQKGRDKVYLPLRDPDMSGPLDLQIGMRSGDYCVHAIEIRGVPR